MKVANAGGFWGDDQNAVEELSKHVPDLDFITIDYLAELSLSIMAVQKKENPSLGYARDFIEVVKNYKGSAKIITNAGGLNPLGLKEALEKVTSKKIVAVAGDDVKDQINQDPKNKLYNNLENGKPLEHTLVTANVYLGAEPIVKALNEGAQIVITGRVADPSLTVAAAIFTYGWTDYNKIAQATIAGHLIECGTQVTGGLYTFWEEVQSKPGFPWVELKEDGSFIVTSYSGLVTVPVVKEQLLYEMGDPGNYLSPDVTVSILDLQLEDLGKNRVKVTGAKGAPPPPTYKVSATFEAGFKAEGSLLFIGSKSRMRAEKAGQIILKTTQPERSKIDLISEGNQTYLHVTAFDASEKKLKQFVKSFAPLVTSGPPGTTGYTSSRQPVRPVFGYWPCLFERSRVCAFLK